jgi:AbrB family looped-hinge helix DNA binding protein
MHINEKGQVTIPQMIREKFGFLPYTEIDFQEEDSKVVLVKKEDVNRRGVSIIKALRHKGDINITTDEIMKYTRS